jgi:hypothetical protein
MGRLRLEEADSLDHVLVCEPVAAANPTRWDATLPSLFLYPPLRTAEHSGDFGRTMKQVRAVLMRGLAGRRWRFKVGHLLASGAHAGNFSLAM